MNRNAKVVSIDEIRAVIAEHQERGEKVVQCSGVFNVVHHGHLGYFDFARSLGDVLVVSVNSDNALRQLRGENYQWVSQEARCEILTALDVVDYVIVFDSTSAVSAIRAVRPNVFVKGADYKHNLPQDEILALSECNSELVFKELIQTEGVKTAARYLVRSEGLLLRKYVERFAASKVIVIGDYALDVYTYGVVNRMSREAPVPILTREHPTVVDSVLGQAGNCVLNFKTLGAEVLPVGVVGADRTARTITDLLDCYGITSDGLQTIGGFVTPRKERIFAHNVNALNQQVARIDDDEGPVCMDHDHIAYLVRTVREHIDKYDCVVFSDYGYGVCSAKTVEPILELCREHNKPIIADSRYQIGLYRGVYAVMPSEAEVKPFLNQPITSTNVGAVVESLRDELAVDYAVITRGSEGMILSDGEQITTFPGKKDVVDATGAGDVALALFTLSLLSGATAVEAAQLSTTGVAISLMQKGTCVLTRDELSARLQIGLL